MGEEMPATPGWVDGELDQVLGGLPDEAQFAEARASYDTCLAGCIGDEPQLKRDRCRQVLLERLADLGLASDRVQEIGRRLEAVEEEVDERT